jgi:hypothetical protein
MGQGLLDQDRHRLVIEHIAAGIDQPILAVGGEGVEGDVGDDRQVRPGLLEGAHRPLGQAIGIEGLAGVLGLGLGRGHGEEGDGGDAQVQDLASLRQQQVDTFALHPGHGVHRLAPALAFQDEDGINQVFWSQPRLAHQPAGKDIAAHTARAERGETGAGRVIRGHGRVHNGEKLR